MLEFGYSAAIHAKFCEALQALGIAPDQDLLLIIADLIWILHKTMFKVDELERKVGELEASNGKNN